MIEAYSRPSTEYRVLERYAPQRAEDIAQRSTQTFEEPTSSVTPAAQSLIGRLQQLENPPEEIGLEFGIQPTAGTGAFKTAQAAEANLKVSLTWRVPSAR